MASAATFLLIIAAAAWTSLTDAAPSPPPFVPPPPCAPPQSAVAFLRARCATTLYAVACYESLLPYACIFQTSHVKLARAAGDVNAAWLRSISKRVKELVARGAAGGGGTAGGAKSAALRDCASTVSSAAGLAKQSAAELAKLDVAGATAGRSQVRWAISNAQTWLSASMTNEATCADGLADTGAAASSPVAREVLVAVVGAKELTSNALALVRGIPVPP
jgi:pectinesterase inhibitor-like protein